MADGELAGTEARDCTVDPLPHSVVLWLGTRKLQWHAGVVVVERLEDMPLGERETELLQNRREQVRARLRDRVDEDWSLHCLDAALPPRRLPERRHDGQRY